MVSAWVLKQIDCDIPTVGDITAGNTETVTLFDVSILIVADAESTKHLKRIELMAGVGVLINRVSFVTPEKMVLLLKLTHPVDVESCH
jgi:hypothetical protein